MTQSINPMNAPDPAALELDAQLDLLVDDELPEDERRKLLTAMDRNPAQWRQVATRFLERQTERKAVRQFIAAGSSPATDERTSHLPPTYPFPVRRHFPWMKMRGIAAMLVIGIISAYGGMTFGPHGASTNTNVAGMGTQGYFNASLPAALTGSTDSQQNVSVQVPLVASDQLPANYPLDDAPHDAQGAHHVVIMPMDDGRAVMFPVNTMTNGEYH